MNRLIIFLIPIWVMLLSQNQAIGQQLITSDTTWSSDTIKIYNDIVVQYPATLTIHPGVYVAFQGNYSIEVTGKIKAVGSANLPVTFTVADTTSFADTTTLAGGWGGIKFLQNQNDTSILNYCNFSNGKAIQPGSSPLNPYNEDLKGGAIYANGYASILIENSVFSNNMACFSGGAIMVINQQSCVIRNSFFHYNRVLAEGGAVWINNVTKIDISNNIFTRNQAIRFSETAWGTMVSGSGSAIWLGAQTNNSIIFNNRIANNISVNGALYETSYKCFVFNNLIVNNKGPGLMNGHSVSVSSYSNNTVANNEGFVHKICGLIIISPNIKVRNMIIYGNESDEIYWDPIQLYTLDDVKADLAYSCNPDRPDFYEGEGNIHEDPQFVNPTVGAGPDYDGLAADWSLLDSSPCVNTGTPDTTGLNLPATDLLGNPRIYGIRVDMGAIENQLVVGLPQNPLVNARIQVSPNPFGQSFKVIAPSTEKINSISLFNQNGQQIATETMMPFEQMLVFDLAHQSPGLYLLVTRFADGSTETTKLVKY